MSETASPAPPAPGFAKHPGYRVAFLPCEKRVRAQLGGVTVADSTRVLLLRETGHVPVYYFPEEDVRRDLMEPSDHRTYCPFKGHASHWTLAAGGRRAEDAAWSYETPYREVPEIRGTVAFYWDRMDRWLEEDEEVFVHARDPFVRIDILETHRPLRVVVDGVTVAETERARLLFETGLPRRAYIPREDVRADLLVPSDKETACPYKGTAGYYSLRVGENLHPDLAWFYADPLPEVARIRDHLAFYDEKVDAVVLDPPANS